MKVREIANVHLISFHFRLISTKLFLFCFLFRYSILVLVQSHYLMDFTLCVYGEEYGVKGRQTTRRRDAPFNSNATTK